MTQHNFNLNDREEDFVITKLGLNKNAQESIALQIKSWLLSPENVEDFETQKEKLTIEKLEKGNENLGYKNRIDSIRADQYETYDKTFDKSPSREGGKAIESYAQRDFTNEEYQNITKFITVRKDSQNLNLWNMKCDLCREGESYQTHKEGIDDMVRHVTTEHGKLVRYVR